MIQISAHDWSILITLVYRKIGVSLALGLFRCVLSFSFIEKDQTCLNLVEFLCPLLGFGIYIFD